MDVSATSSIPLLRMMLTLSPGENGLLQGSVSWSVGVGTPVMGTLTLCPKCLFQLTCLPSGSEGWSTTIHLRATSLLRSQSGMDYSFPIANKAERLSHIPLPFPCFYFWPLPCYWVFYHFYVDFENNYFFVQHPSPSSKIPPLGPLCFILKVWKLYLPPI